MTGELNVVEFELPRVIRTDSDRTRFPVPASVSRLAPDLGCIYSPMHPAQSAINPLADHPSPTVVHFRQFHDTTTSSSSTRYRYVSSSCSTVIFWKARLSRGWGISYGNWDNDDKTGNCISIEDKMDESRV